MPNAIEHLLDNARSFSNPSGGPAECRAVRDLLAVQQQVGDTPIPTSLEARNEVHTIGEETGFDGGTYTITLNLHGGVQITTAAIAFGANAAAILSAINTACSGNVAGWVNGHIAVAGGPIGTDNVVLTFSGASVSGRSHDLTTVDSSELTLDTDPVEVPITAELTAAGQGIRSAWAMMLRLSILAGTIPNQGDLPSGALTVASGRGNYPFSVCNDTVLALIDEIAIQDDNADLVPFLRNLLGY